MIYTIDQYYTFPVRPGNPTDDFFVLEVDGPEGPDTANLAKLDFQKAPSYRPPRRIECRVRGIDEHGLPILGPAIASYVSELYSGIYARGESFECVVAGIPANPAEDPYNVRDRHGIYFRIYEPEVMLTKGQRIRCKFKTLRGKRFELLRVDEKSKLPFLQPAELVDNAGVGAATRPIILRMFDRPAFETVRAEIEAGKSQWPLTAAALVRDNLSEWFVALQLDGYPGLTRRLLSDIKKVFLYLLEGSGFLNAAPREQRRVYQQLLTELVEGIDPYNRALNLITNGEDDDFVQKIFDKLQKSGYLYHPAKQFGAMMLIFRVYPAKVSSYLSRVFESIFTRDLDNWKREPFQSAFVEQFQIYVRQMRREIDSMPLAESREQKQRIETIITALALELLLAGKDEAMARTRSLFYRYVSLLRPLSGEALLSKSFLALLGAELPDRLEYSMLREPMMMMTQATVMPAGDIFKYLPNNFHYSNGTVDLTVNDSGISLCRSAERGLRDEGGTERVVPEGLMSWLRPQIYLNGIKGLSGSKLRSLADHSSWWKQIETALFEQAVPVQEYTELRDAVRDEEVWITIDGVANAYDNDPRFLCHIEHEGIKEAKGYIQRSQIVNYNMRQPSPLCYTTPTGENLGFYAKVINIDADGNYEFSLIDQVNAYIQDVLNFSDEYLAVVTGVNPQGYSAISRDGIGLYLRDDSGTDRHFSPGDIVHFRHQSGSTQGSIVGYITDTPTSEIDHFDKTTAFNKLMNAIGEAQEQTDDETILNDDIEELLPADAVRELIEIIRFSAIANSDLIKAYDYLSFGRLLALAIGDQALAGKLHTHAALLGQHQYYAANSRIDADQLEKLRSLLHNDPFLAMIFHRLEMVSWLGKPERNSALFATVGNPANELEGSIARMVLSYNMMQSQDDNDTIAASLKDRIMSKLNVNSETKRGTYYGRESKYLEFKTSTVYVATAPGEEMREDPAAQQAHILTRIAGLLNANGGTLYLGVNDEGYAVGLRDDFRYYERHKARIGTRYMDVRSMSNYCVFLEHLVNSTFGETVARKIEISADDKADKDVIVIAVKESLTPVFYQGRLFVRQSGEVTKEYFDQNAVDDFVAEREQQRLERMHMLAAAAEAEAEKNAAAAPAEAETAAAPAAAAPTPEPEAAPTEPDNAVATSRWRPNVLHYYDEGYNEPEGYLYFTGENQIEFSKSDIYRETEPGCRLALTIPHELRNGYLLLGYENERVVRVPLAEIYERGDQSVMNHSADYKLLFAAIAAKDDLLLVMAADSNNTVWRRAFQVGLMEQGHVSNIPRRVNDNPTNYTVGYEVVDASVSENFTSCLNEHMAGRRFGETMRVKTTDAHFADKMNRQIEACRPTNN